MRSEDVKAKVKDLLLLLSKDEQVLFQRIVRAELEKLHMSNPYGIKDDLERIVREVIR